jgi:translocator protein
MRPIFAVLIFVGAPILTGAIGAIASITAPAFYRELQRPSWAPPPSLFGPVWTTLYLMMGVAAFLVWRAHGWEGARGALLLFIVHLAVNALWSWLFFRWGSGTGSLIDIAALWLLVLTLMIWFFRLHVISGALMVPYLAWVTFAAALNLTIVRMNPAKLLH